MSAGLGFEELLRVKLPNYDPNLIPRCRQRLGSLVLQAVNEQDSDVAVQAYEYTLNLPQASTEAAFSTILGYEVNGQAYVGHDGLVICHKGTVTYLLKSLNEKEAARGKAFFNALKEREGEELKRNPHLTSFEIISHSAKEYMVMPHYSSTLEQIKRLSLEDGVRLFNQIHNALSFIHSMGFVHMDLKPANICVKENGDFILIDLGSVARVNEYSESTVVYVPTDYQPRVGRMEKRNTYLAQERVDWLMLGVTIAQVVYKLEIGGTPSTPTVDELIKQLDTDAAFTELISLMKPAI